MTDGELSELADRREQVDELQQILDESIVALPGSSLGVKWRDIPKHIADLKRQLAEAKVVALKEVRALGMCIEDLQRQLAALERQLAEANAELKPLKDADAEVQEACRLMDEEIEQAGGLIPLLKEKVETKRELQDKLDRCSELLASEAAECGKLKRQLEEAEQRDAAHWDVLERQALRHLKLQKQAVQLQEIIIKLYKEHESAKVLMCWAGWKEAMEKANEALVGDSGQGGE